MCPGVGTDRTGTHNRDFKTHRSLPLRRTQSGDKRGKRNLRRS